VLRRCLYPCQDLLQHRRHSLASTQCKAATIRSVPRGFLFPRPFACTHACTRRMCPGLCFYVCLSRMYVWMDRVFVLPASVRVPTLYAWCV
jgi:hypothetical protein